MPRFILFAALALALLTTVSTADAYTYESRLATGCHERLAAAALRAVRRNAPAAPVASRDDRALMDDLPFELPGDLNDVAGASLLIGVRDNDLHGRGPIEIDSLARVHGDPSHQREHCLRGPEQDEPDGTKRALEDCKAFIREKVGAAIDGLEQTNKRVDVDVTLVFRGRVTAKLPELWVEIGRALHTLQDSFTHTFRTPDRTKVRVTENWSEEVAGTRIEERDGPAHRGEMDECEGLDEYRAKSFANAQTASNELLQAVLDPALATREQKLAAVDRTLDKWLSYEPGCTSANGWCSAPENDYAVAASACTIAPGGVGGAFAACTAAIACIALAARRRRSIATMTTLALVALPNIARAQEAPPPSPPAPSARPADQTPASSDPPTPAHAPEVPAANPAPMGTPTQEEKKAEKKDAEHRSRFALYGAVSGSLSNESLNGQLGARVRLSERWMVGLDGELNGWFGVNSGRFDAGAFNGYGTLIFRTPLRFADFNLRSTANAGVSVLLIDLYGAPSGTTGIFLGLTPLGLEWKVSSHVFIVLDAIGIALPIPQLSGAPFAYPQYRAAVGVELAL